MAWQSFRLMPAEITQEIQLSSPEAVEVSPNRKVWDLLPCEQVAVEGRAGSFFFVV